MNLKSIFSVVALSALMVGCSSDDLTNEPGAVETPASGETMTGYLNVNINLPTVSATGARALDQSNDQFDDGDPSEYAVNCAHLVVFDTDNEATAKVVGVFSFTDLKPWNTDASTTDNITSSAESVIKVQVTKSDNNLGALVVLNDPAAETHFRNKTFQSLFEDGPIVDLTAMQNAKGFVMTNAPLYENNTAKTLVSVLQSSICNSPQEAQQSPAINVYVERAVAKVNVTTSVTLTNSITISTSTTENNEIKNDNVTYKATVKAWALDITNKKSYLVRNVSDFNTWKAYAKGARFYSNDSKRIYWAIDPNYTNGSGADAYIADNFNKITDVPNTADVTAPVYILENTFDVANQMRTRTTRAIIKATFAPEGQDPATFYTIGSAHTIYTKEGMQAFIKGLAVNLLEGKNDASKYTFAPNTSVSNAAGSHSIGAQDILYDGVVLTPEEVAKLNDAIGLINTYKDGICYYVARIQHFGEKYTKWNPGDPTYGQDKDPTTAANNYLGRYGVVRNNWYELQISEIKSLGNPTIPEAPDTPDDEDYSYISFKVNIHSWAKRVQNVIL